MPHLTVDNVPQTVVVVAAAAEGRRLPHKPPICGRDSASVR